MSIQTDTDDLLATSVWGEQVTIVRNTPTYGSDGAGVDSWASISTPNADIQPLGGNVQTMEVGQQKLSTLMIVLPAAANVREGDRIRPSGWVAGDDEYHVDDVNSYEDHVEVGAHVVVGHA